MKSLEKRHKSNQPTSKYQRTPVNARPIKSVQNPKSEASHDYIKDNMMKVILDNQAVAKKQKVANAEIRRSRPEMHKNYGKVPRYLDKYAQERAEAEIVRL